MVANEQDEKSIMAWASLRKGGRTYGYLLRRHLDEFHSAPGTGSGGSVCGGFMTQKHSQPRAERPRAARLAELSNGLS